MSDFTIEMLPACEGDCILLGYADKAAKRRRHVLVDAGRASTWPALKQRLLQLPEAERHLEVLVVSHVDRDHIEGVLAMLRDPACPVTFGDIWFNGYRHLAEDESFGPVQGEKLTEILVDPKRSWNAMFQKRAACSPPNGLLRVPLPGGLMLTILSPTRAKLAALIPDWIAACEEAGLDPAKPAVEGIPGEEAMGTIDVVTEADAPSKKDNAAANGSSIALLAEYDGKRVLLGADAHPDVLAAALKGLGNGAPIALDAWKIAHHGSARNTTKELLALARCERYLISTSGSYFKHPDRIAIARLLKYGGAKHLVFNYRSDYTTPWDDPELRKDCGYATTYGTDGYVAVDI